MDLYRFSINAYEVSLVGLVVLTEIINGDLIILRGIELTLEIARS
jgi:hypothetical protein